MRAGLLIISWLLIKTSVFSSLPLMEVSETRKLLGSLCITMAFNAFNQFQISQAADICTKRLKGLSLPVSDFHVRIGYLLTTLLFTALVCLPLCIIFSRPLYKMALFWFASGISCLLLSFVSDKRWGKRVVTPVSTIILLTGAFLGFVFWVIDEIERKCVLLEQRKELTQTVAVCLLIDMTDTYYVFYYEILEGKVFAVADNSGFWWGSWGCWAGSFYRREEICSFCRSEQGSFFLY